MNATTFIFVVIPATLCFIGGLFSLFFGPEVLRWYNGKLAAQRKQEARFSLVERDQLHEPATYAEPVKRNRERELVAH